ncbi:hypothetical protein [Chengkuizengella sediminis]|uniref:hypothetical protein n=1 Tax=Chengkuizengella sediminis TaxID=1885917 RepID=UPI001389DF40|nr:hypothetical protein [Chengkuizengella sediminis]NDI35743.1 hypothetical protein [Chengkuizengella sediminis]
MEPAKGVFLEASKDFTSFRKMALKMKPKLRIKEKDYFFIGIYKGYLYGLSDGNLLKYLVVTNTGDIVKDVNITVRVTGLHNLLFQAWHLKEDIKGTLNGNIKFRENTIPLYIEAIEKYLKAIELLIHPNLQKVQQYKEDLKMLKEICYVNPRKRKKLSYNTEELKIRLYWSFNAILERKVYTEEDLMNFIRSFDENGDFNVNDEEWKDLFKKYWIHY